MAIRVELTDAVLKIAFDRPQKRNAITHGMYSELESAFAHADRDPAVRAILLQGEGGTFTSGNDLDDFLNRPATDQNAPAFRFLRQLMRVEKPIVAAVQGQAIGVGVTMLLHCDLVYASHDAILAIPFAKLGLCPEAASSFLLPRLAGHQLASEALLLGEPFSASEAHRMGLVNRTVPVDQVVELATSQARKLAALPASSIRATKALIRKETLDASQARFSQEGELFLALLKSDEAREAFQAFFEGRDPNFQQFGGIGRVISEHSH